MDINFYWENLDIKLDQLSKHGVVKLPSLKMFDLDRISNNISLEMGHQTFQELGSSHEIFLNELGINQYLAPRLFELARKVFNYKGDLDNQYHIARKVMPGNSKEMFRAHFDSHLFTMVIPIKIPNKLAKENIGELVYFPKIRNLPKNEFSNFLGKVIFKRYGSKKGLKKLSENNSYTIDNFTDYQPLLFLGKTTLHANYPVSQICKNYRLTLLAHFFDDSPKFGLGKFLRIIRNR